MLACTDATRTGRTHECDGADTTCAPSQLTAPTGRRHKESPLFSTGDEDTKGISRNCSEVIA